MDSPNALSRRKTALFIFVIVAGFFLLAEAISRQTVPPMESPGHKTHRRIIEVMGLPALNRTMEFDPVRFWRLKERLDDVRIQGSLENIPIDFTVNLRDHRRSPPLDPKKDAVRILALGDSCTFGLGVDDRQTWPAQLENKLREEKLNVQVVNVGTPGYTAFQGLQTLKDQGEALEPDWVVVSFGFNDSDSWGDRSDIQIARSLKMAGWERRLANSRLFDAMRRLLRYGSLASYDPKEELTYDNKEKMREMYESGTLRPRLTAEEFAGIYKEMIEWCNDRGCRLLLTIWPYSEQVEARLHRYFNYQGVIASIARESNLPLVDLVPAFIANPQPLYVDWIHANPEGNRVVAEAIARKLAPLLSDRP